MTAHRSESPIGEQLSAWVDGELSRDEEAFLLRRLEHDDEARERLNRYYVIRNALHRSLPEQPAGGLADRVREHLGDEPAFAGGTAASRPFPRPTDWKRSTAGLALAATVAAVTVTWWSGAGLPGAGPEGGEPVAGGDGASGATVAEQTVGDAERSVAGPGGTTNLEVFQRFMPGSGHTSEPVALGDFGPSVAGGPEPAHAAPGDAARTEWESVDPADLGVRIRELLVDHAEHAGVSGIGSMLDYVRVAGHGEEE